jgi:glycosyltransferase involved in cell wall biosynthesis
MKLQNARLRIAINAQLQPKMGPGGVESVLIGLLNALGSLTDGNEEYVVIGPIDDPEWLRPYLGPNQILYQWSRVSSARHRLYSKLIGVKRLLGPLWSIARGIKRISSGLQGSSPKIPVSQGFYESLGCDVIHFPYQEYTVSGIPSVFNPHDLQHVHYPQFFSAKQIATREILYRGGCQDAQCVVVASQWVKDDLVQHYGIEPEKIQIIPWAPPTAAYRNATSADLKRIKQIYGLPSSFGFYPSMIWEHKNHLRLVEAIAILRDRDGIRVNFVFTGHKDGFWPTVELRIRELHLEEQIHFVGIVPDVELKALYALTQFVFIPSLFEAASAPMFEAWEAGAPVASSTVTSLPDQAGNAALLFDPHSVESITVALKRIATESSLREELIQKGTLRLKSFSWERTAKMYRAVYRRAAKRTLSTEDRDHICSTLKGIEG